MLQSLALVLGSIPGIGIAVVLSLIGIWKKSRVIVTDTEPPQTDPWP